MISEYLGCYEQVREVMEGLGAESAGLTGGRARPHNTPIADAPSARATEPSTVAIGITARCDGYIAYRVHVAEARRLASGDRRGGRGGGDDGRRRIGGLRLPGARGDGGVPGGLSPRHG
jgi:hypothetical protein